MRREDYLSPARLVPLEQGSQEWLAYRRTKRCASESGAVMGHGYLKKAKLRDIKLGLDKVEETPPMLAGREMEPVLRQHACEMLRMPFVPVVMERGRYLASLDGWYDGHILECKWLTGARDPLECRPEWSIQMTVARFAANVKDKPSFFCVGNQFTKAIYEFVPEYTMEQIDDAWNAFEVFASPIETPAWKDAAERYIALDKQMTALDKEYQEAREQLIKLCPEDGGHGLGVYVSRLTRSGPVNMKALGKTVDLDQYRGPPTSYYRIHVKETGV